MVQRNPLKRRTIMRDFVINEVSSVDRPSMEGAVAVLMKRDAGSTQEYEHMQFEKIAERPRAFSTLEDAMEYLQGVRGLSKLDAMERTARERPALVEKFNAEGDAIAKAAVLARAPRPKAKAVSDFEMLAESIKERDGVPMHVAMERARDENPRAFAAYQEA